MVLRYQLNHRICGINACFVLTAWLAAAAPPTQTVSNVRFADNDTHGGWIAGTVLWDAPDTTDGISSYGVVAINSLDDLNPVPPVPPGDVNGALYISHLGNISFAPVGANSIEIPLLPQQSHFPRRGSVNVQPQHRRRYIWGHSHPSDRYLAVFCMNAAKEAGPASVIPIYDQSELVPFEHLSAVSFADTNPNLGVLSGKVDWTPDAEGDFTLTQKYFLFLSSDDVGTDQLHIGESFVPNFHLMLTDVNRGNRDFIRIYGINSNGVSEWAKSFRIFDLSQSVPAEGVSQLSFEDGNMEVGKVVGIIRWTPPDDEAPISSYRIFLSNGASSPSLDQGASGGSIFGGMLPGSGAVRTFERVPPEGYSVPVGTNEFELPAYVIRSQSDYIQVFAENDKGLQALPTELAIVDRFQV